jgi:tRNA A58 N-methylase Trm61
MVVAEVGTTSGFVARAMAAQVGPTGRVIADATGRSWRSRRALDDFGDYR